MNMVPYFIFPKKGNDETSSQKINNFTTPSPGPLPGPTPGPPLPNPLATKASISVGVGNNLNTSQKLYWFDNNNFTRITIDNVDSKVIDISGKADDIFYVLENGKLIVTKIDDNKNTVSINEYQPKFKIIKLRSTDFNGFYALSDNNLLFWSPDLQNWKALFTNVVDFDIPYEGDVVWVVKSDNTSLTLNPNNREISNYFNFGEIRVYGRNKNEYVTLKNNKIIRVDGKEIEGGTKAVYDKDGNLHVLSVDQKIENDKIMNLYGTKSSVIYQV